MNKKIWPVFLLLVQVGLVNAQLATTRNQNTDDGYDQSSSARRSREQKQASSIARSVSINGAVLDAYLDAFETESTAMNYCESYPTISARFHKKFLKEGGFTNIVSQPKRDFPVWSWMQNKVVPLEVDERLQSERSATMGNLNKPMRSWVTGDDPFVVPSNDATDPYLRSVAIADAIVYRVVSGVAVKNYANEDDVRAKIKEQICNINYGDVLEEASKILSRVNCTAARYPQWEIQKGGYSRPFLLTCGAIYVDADNQKYKVNGRDTLSQEAIRGVNVKIDLVAEQSKNQLEEISTSEYKKKSSTTTKQKVSP